jgi:hypothetical protein
MRGIILQGKDFLKWGNLSEQRRGILSERYRYNHRKPTGCIVHARS